MWFLSSFGFVDGGFGLVEESADSILAMLGGAIAILFRPLGFGEWQPVAASITGFTAKEAIVSTMGVLANVSEDLSEETDVVAAAIRHGSRQPSQPLHSCCSTCLTLRVGSYRNDGTAAPVQKMVLVRYPVSESLRLRGIPDCISVRWSGNLAQLHSTYGLSWQQSFWYSCSSCCSVRIHTWIRRATQEAL